MAAVDALPKVTSRFDWFLRLDPVQRLTLIMGAWFVVNGVGAFILYPAFTTGTGQGDLNGYFPLLLHVNGWHALFHLVPGLLGLAAVRDVRWSRVWAAGMATLYMAAGVWGLLSGSEAFGFISVERFGSVVHVIEATVAASVLAFTLLAQRKAMRQIVVVAAAVVLSGLLVAAVAAAASGNVVNMCCCGAC